MDFDTFNMIFAASFFGCLCVFSIVWGGFNSMKYAKDEYVPFWTWVAMLAPLIPVAAALYSIWR